MTNEQREVCQKIREWQNLYKNVKNKNMEEDREDKQAPGLATMGLKLKEVAEQQDSNLKDLQSTLEALQHVREEERKRDEERLISLLESFIETTEQSLIELKNLQNESQQKSENEG